MTLVSPSQVTAAVTSAGQAAEQWPCLPAALSDLERIWPRVFHLDFVTDKLL